MNIFILVLKQFQSGGANACPICLSNENKHLSVENKSLKEENELYKSLLKSILADAKLITTEIRLTLGEEL